MITERLVKKTQDGTLGTPTDDPWPEPDDMAVSVGDHYEVNETKRGLMDKITPALIVGAALSMPFGWAAAMNYLKPEPVVVEKTPAAPPAEKKDDDTLFDLRLGGP